MPECCRFTNFLQEPFFDGLGVRSENALNVLSKEVNVCGKIVADDIDCLAGEKEKLANLVERLGKASTA